MCYRVHFAELPACKRGLDMRITALMLKYARKDKTVKKHDNKRAYTTGQCQENGISVWMDTG